MVITGGLNLDKKKHILITGPNNPLGQCFVNGLIRNYPNSNLFSLSRSVKIKNFGNIVHHIPFDLSKDNYHYPENIDILVHTASAVPSTTQNHDEYFQINFEGSKRLIENIKFSNDAKILNISTSSVYDDPIANVLNEDSKKTTKDPYGLSKMMFEQYLKDRFEHSTIKFLTCRIPVLLVNNVRNNFISKWLINIKERKSITIFNPDSLLNACILGEEILKFFLYFANKRTAKSLICNLSTKHPIKIITAANYMMDLLGIRVEIIEKNIEQKAQLVSNKLAVKNGFKPKSVKESLKSYILD